MAFPLLVTAAQVGTYFVGQYYQMLQSQPDFVHQFYSDASTMLRVDGNERETATSMLHIHQLVTTLNYTGIEIKTAHSLESWSGGVLVMVSGSVCAKNFNGRKKFMETFFLAPQEKGYFVLNDVFLYVEEEQILPHPAVYLPQSNIDAKLNSSAISQEQANNSYMVGGGDIQSREFVSPSKVQENGPVNNYDYPEEHLKQVPETEITAVDDDFAAHSNGSLKGTLNHKPEPQLSSVVEPIVESQKHTYASIVAKGQNGHNKTANVESPHMHENPSQPPVLLPNRPAESLQVETPEEPSVVEDEVEVKSVYVRNVPTRMPASEIAEEFKKFGTIKPDGVAIRTRKDADICYAFVEFEDIMGVQNAIKASTVQIGSHQLHIEERRPNKPIISQGGRGRGGRGRFGYHTEGTRGRFVGRGFGRASNNDSYERDYYSNRSRGNGFYRQTHRQERAYNARNAQQDYEE